MRSIVYVRARAGRGWSAFARGLRPSAKPEDPFNAGEQDNRAKHKIFPHPSLLPWRGRFLPFTFLYYNILYEKKN